MFLKKESGKCKAIITPFAVYLNENDNYVEPDMMVVCDKDKLDENGCHGAPDLIIEVVSPGSVRMDYSIKLFKYRSFGVREYWIVDPAKNRITVHDLEHEETLALGSVIC
ncbi:Uma2 family endonuclease [Hespellia stercorisuis]|uniref:Putative restriction endonuclease n=1 Tax=Hespellia stercorisuis DSM 15480 TaxID=1121950 RepID=A0A1M6KJU9_9FIRM|nr:Putative restriction endonuclease [Hespellia stercorisuis DSM 15480]